MKKKLFLVTNAGLHPVNNKLKRQFGSDIIIADVTYGNVPLSLYFAKDVARKTRDVVIEHDDAEVFVVFSGFPIYNLVVFETVRKVFNKLPIVLIYNKETQDYMQFDLDVRRLLFEDGVAL
jgi:hypothetical protein